MAFHMRDHASSLLFSREEPLFLSDKVGILQRSSFFAQGLAHVMISYAAQLTNPQNNTRQCRAPSNTFLRTRHGHEKVLGGSGLWNASLSDRGKLTVFSLSSRMASKQDCCTTFKMNPRLHDLLSSKFLRWAGFIMHLLIACPRVPPPREMVGI